MTPNSRCAAGRLRGAGFFLVIAMSLAVPAAARAQAAAPALLSLLPAAGDRVLPRGEARTGTLSAAGAHLLPDGRRVVAWTLNGRAGETVTVDLGSAAFDAILYVVSPDGRTSWNDDDSGGGCDARLEIALPAAGRYVVVASGLDSSADGEYRLLVRNGTGHEAAGAGTCGGDGEPDTWEMPDPRGAIAVGETVRGKLDESAARARDGSWLHAWQLRGATAGERLYVLLHSTEFDAFVEARGASGGESDDDSGGGCDALLEWTVPATGPYHIFANTVAEGQSGAYELTVSRTRPAPRSGGCMEGDAPTFDAEPSGSIAAGETKTATMGSVATASGVIYQAWEVRGAAGDSITVDLVSDAFDALLVLMEGSTPVLTDDDGAGRCDARLTFRIPEGGRARVIATSVESTGRGEFTLVASRRAPPARAGECGG